MTEYSYSYPVDVRYGDLDSQGHLNNARYLTYIEQARVGYLVKLGLFDGKHFDQMPVIVADIHISYLIQIEFGQIVDVKVRVTRIGNKSIVFEEVITDQAGEITFARSEVVVVAYDYLQKTSISVPSEWRKRISEFEKINL